MKVYVYPGDKTGCGHSRLIWPSEALRKAGYDVTIIYPEQHRDISATVVNDVVVDVSVPLDADVLVLQRVTHRYLADAIPIMRKKGVSVVVDMDDDLSCVHPKNPAWTSLHPRMGQPDHNWEHAARACDNASLVTVSTPALSNRYGKPGQVNVLYNCVPERYLDLFHGNHSVIGWGGSVHSHPDDLQMVGFAIARLQTEGHEFMTVGSPLGVKDALRLTKDFTSLGAVSIADWPNALTQIGVGIAPLSSTKFNEAKSWLKPLEMASVGVPCVMSPLPEYRRIHDLGVGLLAKKPRDWYQILNALTSDPVKRFELAQKGYKVAREFTYEKNCTKWWSAWQAAVEIDNDMRKHALI